MKGRARAVLRQALPPLVLFAAFIAVWQIAVTAFDIPRYLLPGPVLVGRAAVENADPLVSATLLTAAGAVAGFSLSLVAGTLIAFGFSQSKVIRNSFYPYAIFLQTVPIVAIAPLIITWFGYGFQSVVIVAFILSLFPIITNGTTGLTAVDPDLIDLFRLHRASRWQVLWKLRLPNSVPYLITGAKISSGAAVIGAIVGEYFAGYGAERYGLGYLVMQWGRQLKTSELVAAVIASTLLGVAIFGTISAVGAMILRRWYDPPAG